MVSGWQLGLGDAQGWDDALLDLACRAELAHRTVPMH